jgi:ABC-2 type transport system permease protein
MEEAEKLCDRVAIIDHGRIVDIGDPVGLVRRHCPEKTVFVTTADPGAAEWFGAITHVDAVEADNDRLTIRGAGNDLVTDVIGCVAETTIMLRGLWRLTWLEIKIFVRGPLGLFGTVGVPVLLFVIVGRAVGPRMRRGVPGLPDLLSTDLPILVALMIALSTVLSLVTIVAIYREGGILKRLRATPLRPHTILTAHVLVKLLFTAITRAAMVLAGRRFYPIGAEVPLVSFAVALLFTTACILSVGFVVASVVPTARFAQPLGALFFYPMLGLSGLFVDLAAMPPALQVVARSLPLTPAVSRLRGIWHGEGWLAHTSDVAALVLVFLIGVAVSSRVFRWE